jgi:hypothetical protein
LLLIAAVVTMVAFAVPLTIAGASRVAAAVGDWRSDSTADWRPTRGRILAVRDDGKLSVRVRYRDEVGASRTARVDLDGRTDGWLGPQVSMRYDANDNAHVDLVADGTQRPVVDLLLAGAPLGAGLAGLVTAFLLWRRRHLIMASDHQLMTAGSAAVVGGILVLTGLGAWAVGTVLERGWSGIGASVTDMISTAFAELLGVLVPILTFAIGCLLTAWLARNRHRLPDDGVLSEAYGLLDRAAEVAPTPDELTPDGDDEPDRTRVGMPAAGAGPG